MTSDVISAFDVSRELEEKNDNGEIIIPKNKQKKPPSDLYTNANLKADLKIRVTLSN